MSTNTKAATAPEPLGDGLNSPPDSNPALKDSGSDSELSDLEPDSDISDKVEEKPDIKAEIKPAYFSDGGVPVFKPAMAEFADFDRCKFMPLHWTPQLSRAVQSILKDMY